MIVGALVAVAGGALADPLGTPQWLTIAVGSATVVWGVFVLRLSGRPNWLPALTWVLAANYVAGLPLAAFALTPGGARLRLFLSGLTALAVLWFAVTQSIIRLNAGASG